MAKQVLIVGLGEFGMSLAKALAEQRVEVIAVDSDQNLVQIASEFAAQARCLDATDEDALSELAPEKRDVCVCAIGGDSREASILVTAMLRQMGAERVLARATDKLLERILRVIGAHEVISPEREVGQRLATRLLYNSILEEIPLGPDLTLTKLQPLEVMVGRTLAELELPERFDITVVAVRRQKGEDDEEVISQPDIHRELDPNDILVVVSPPGATRDLSERW